MIGTRPAPQSFTHYDPDPIPEVYPTANLHPKYQLVSGKKFTCTYLIYYTLLRPYIYSTQSQDTIHNHLSKG